MAEENRNVLIDYIKWRGDLPFERDPLNETDNVILCQLSYLDCSAVLPEMDPKGRTLREVYEEIKQKGIYRLLTVTGGEEAFVAAAAASDRFGNLRITNHVDKFDHRQTQFAAMHFELDDHTSYIAFRGTDNSLMGWREDFMTAFTMSTGQKMARDYVNETLKHDRKYYIGGHSKGGNHAVFAVSCLMGQQQEQVIRVFNNDGPGFCPDVFDVSSIDAIRDKITKIVPSYDVIGQLFSRNIPDTKIIESTNSGLLQHDAVSWCVDGPRLKTLAALDPAVLLLNDALKEWIENVEQKERETFVKTLFDGLAAKGAVTLNDLRLQDITDSIKTVFGSKETSRIVMDLPKAYFSTATKYAAEAIEQFAEEKIQQLNEKGNKHKTKKQIV